MTRSEAYQWLCEVMNKTEEEGHIARFDIDECERLMELVKQKGIELQEGK
jgi:zinc-finger-containing domain